MDDIEQIRAELMRLVDRTPRADRIDTINKVRTFKRVSEKARKLKTSKNVEELRSTLAEMRMFHPIESVAA